MVVYQTKKPYFGIVDGQQRLTTITLILSTIRNTFLKIGEENLAKGVHKYIEQANIDNEDEFILKAETSFPYLQSHIQSFDGYKVNCEVRSEEKKLEIAFSIINKKICEAIPELADVATTQANLFTNHETHAVQALKEFRDKVLALKLVFIQLDNEDDAYLIFETLNARGRDLTTSDLVKNLILKKIKNTSVSIDQAKESWNSIVRNFDSFTDTSVVDFLLLHYWVSEYKYCTEKKLFSEIKNYINDDSIAAKQLIHNLSSTAQIYSSLLQPDNVEWSKEEEEVKRSLRALNLFKVKQQKAITLALIRSYKNGFLKLRSLKKALSIIEDFHNCFNAITSQRSSGSIASNYSRLAILLTKAKTNEDIQLVFNDLKTFLVSKLPDLEEFVVKFSELEYSSNNTKYKAIVKYTLSKLIPSNNGGLTVDFDRLTIEHIVPESQMESEEYSFVASIGNLILLDEKTNCEDLANKKPEDKFELLNSEKYPLRQSLIESDAWDKDTTEKRTKALAEKIYKELRANIMR